MLNICNPHLFCLLSHYPRSTRKPTNRDSESSFETHLPEVSQLGVTLRLEPGSVKPVFLQLSLMPFKDSATQGDLPLTDVLWYLFIANRTDYPRR